MDLVVGTIVGVHSLKGRPELNGRRGIVVSTLDPHSLRFGVQVDEEEKPIALKPANLKLRNSVMQAENAKDVSDPTLHDALCGMTARFDPEDTSEEALIHAVARIWKSDACSTPKQVHKSLSDEGQWRPLRLSVANVKRACSEASKRGLIKDAAAPAEASPAAAARQPAALPTVAAASKLSIAEANSEAAAFLPQIAAGRWHTLWSTEGSVHSCGGGDFEDCTGGDQDEYTGDAIASDELLEFCRRNKSTPSDCKFTAHLGQGALETVNLQPPKPAIVRMPSSCKVVQIAAGGLHGLALDEGGVAWAWGWGGNGRLGLGDTDHRTQPTRMTGARLTGGRSPDQMPRIQQIACGTEHSLALTCEGQMLSFGRDHLGQLGLGRMMDDEEDWSPTARVYPMGGFNDDVLLPTLVAWHCPDGPAQQQSTMVTMMGLESSSIVEPLDTCGGSDSTTGSSSCVRFTQVSAGGEHNLALSADGRIFAWGCPHGGRLGRPPPWDYVCVPTRVPSMSRVSKVSAGKFNSLALAADGNVYVWGECGTGFAKEVTSPKRLPALDPKKLGSRVIGIYAGSEAEHSIVVTASGRALKLEKTVTPVAEVGGQSIAAAAVGAEHSILVLASGELRGVGKDDKGQLGFAGVNAKAQRPVKALPAASAAVKHVAKAANQVDDATADDATAGDGGALDQNNINNDNNFRLDNNNNTFSLDATLDLAEQLGLITEASRDTLTDSIARAEVTEAALEEEWIKKVALHLRATRGERSEADLMAELKRLEAADATVEEAADSAAEARSMLEEVLCSEADGLKINRVTLHFDDTKDVAALLQVNHAIREQLMSLDILEPAAFEGDEEEGAEDPRTLWYAMCRDKGTALGVEHHYSQLRRLVSKVEEWNAEDDGRPEWLCADLAADPIVYSLVLDAAVTMPGEPRLAALQRFAAVCLVAERSRVLQTLFNLKDDTEAHELRDSLLNEFAGEMAGIATYRADDLQDPPEEREREEELQVAQQTLLALLVCTLASLAPLLHDNLAIFGDTQISGRYLHIALVGGYLQRPGHFHTVGEDGRLSRAFPLNEAVRPELALAVDALTLLVWWPQFRAHTAHMGMLRQSLAAITSAAPLTQSAKLREHAHFDDLRLSLEAADHYAATGSPFPASRRRQPLGGERGVRLEEQPYVAAVLHRAAPA